MGKHKHSNFVSSVSPNGKELGSLDISNNKLQTWQLSENGLRSMDHDCDHLSLTTNPASIAISNRGKDGDIYIAISRICDKDIQVEEKEFNDDLQGVSVDSGSDGTLFTPTPFTPTPFTPTSPTPTSSTPTSSTPTSSTPTSFTPTSSSTHYNDNPSVDTYYDPSTYASSTTVDFTHEQAITIIHINKAGQTNQIMTPLISELKGGIVKFIDSNTLMILRGKEFTRVIFENENISSESFPYPESMMRELKMRSLKSSKSLLNSTVIKNYFFLSKSTQQNIIYEMYGLDDLELKHVFHVKKVVDNPSCEYTNDEVRTPLFAMSENGKLLAASLCKKIVTIFLIENSLMVASYNFCKHPNSDLTCNNAKSTKIKILDMKFFDNDNKLVVLTQERNEVYTTIWDLFNCNVQNPYIDHLDPSIIPLLDEPIDHGMRKCVQICGRSLGIFSNYLVYPAQLTKGSESSGVNLISFEEKHRESKYENIIDGSEKDFYNDFIQNSNQKIRYKIFDCNGKKLLNNDDLIIEDSEPWDNTPNKFQIVVWLDSKKTIQLIIGHESIQVWGQHKKLVYIWTPLLSQEYYLKPSTSTSNRVSRSIRRHPLTPQGSMNFIALTTPDQPSNYKIHHFTLKKFTTHQYQYKMTFSFGVKQFYKYLPREKDYIKSACNAIEFLGWQMKHTEYLDNKLRRYLNKTIQETRLLIKKFIKEQPQTWKLLDIRECTMSHLVAARCDDLISYIVVENRDLMLHNPRKYAWSEREVMECNRLVTNFEEIQAPKRGIPQIFGKRERKSSDKNNYLRKPSDLKIAIDRTNKNAVKGLVNYYSTLSMNNIGWMFTVSDELLELLHYNSDYVEELFYQPIFGAMEALHLNKAKVVSDIPPPGSKNSIRALYDVQTKLTGSPKTTKSLNNKLTDAPWVMTCIVPLPDFTVSKNGFQSSFSQMVSISSSNDGMDFIFDNPAMEAIVNFKWFKYAKRRIYFLLVLYAFYKICFGFLCYSYIRHLPSTNWMWNLTIISICWILLFGGFLLYSEVNQVLFLKRKYIRIYNIFDLLSSILPLIGTMVLLKDSFDGWMIGKSGFEGIETNKQLLILLSMTILTLWIQLLMKMRSLPIIGEYVFIIINLSKKIAPFLVAMLVIIFGLAHSMFILLSYPQDIGLEPNLSKYTLTNQKTQEIYIMEESINVGDRYDNVYSDVLMSIKAVYFWINGQWDQLGLWNFWPVIALSMFGSLFLVIIMQNILIALMSDVVDEAKEIGKRAFLKLRAELISEVEISYLSKKQLQDKNLFPKYIYYIINCDEADDWKEKCKKRNSIGHFNNGEKKMASQEKDQKKSKRESFKGKGEGSVYKMEKIHEENSNIVPCSDSQNSDCPVKKESNDSNISNTTNIGYDGNNKMVENNSDSLESKDSRLEGKIADLERDIKTLLELARNNNK